MSHNDVRDWYGGGWFAVFEQFVETPITPDPSLVGQEVTFNCVVAKLIDESTCLFRRETRPFETAPLVLFGEIHFAPEGYLVIGRLPGSPGDQVVVSLVLIFFFAIFLSQAKNLFILLGLLLLFILLAGLLFHSFTSEQDKLRKAYPKVIDWVQSGKVRNRLDYFSKDTILACALCGATADFVCKHCRKPFCEHHIHYYTTSHEQYPRYWVGYFCADCRKGHEEAWRGLLAVLAVIIAWIIVANIIDYIQHLKW